MPKESVHNILCGESSILQSCSVQLHKVLFQEEAVLTDGSPGCLGTSSAAAGPVPEGIMLKHRENSPSSVSLSCSVISLMGTLQFCEDQDLTYVHSGRRSWHGVCLSSGYLCWLSCYPCFSQGGNCSVVSQHFGQDNHLALVQISRGCGREEL